jgi:hypothetical protein
MISTASGVEAVSVRQLVFGAGIEALNTGDALRFVGIFSPSRPDALAPPVFRQPDLYSSRQSDLARAMATALVGKLDAIIRSSFSRSHGRRLIAVPHPAFLRVTPYQNYVGGALS